MKSLLACGLQSFTSLLAETVMPPAWMASSRVSRFLLTNLNATSQRADIILFHFIPSPETIQKIKQNFSANNFRIINTASLSDLNICEIMHIHRDKPALNIHQQATDQESDSSMNQDKEA